MARMPRREEQRAFARDLYETAHSRLVDNPGAIEAMIAERDSRGRTTRVVLLAVSLVATLMAGLYMGGCAAGCAFADTPATGTYGGPRCDGWPLIDDGDGELVPAKDCRVGAPLDSAVVRWFAAQEFFVQGIDLRPDIYQAVWRANPRCKRLAKVTITFAGPWDSKLWYGVVEPLKALRAGSSRQLDLARPEVVDAVADFILDEVARPRFPGSRAPAWHGVHLEACDAPDSAWHAGFMRLHERIAAEAPAGFILYANCGKTELAAPWSRMLEGWPHQQLLYPTDPARAFSTVLDWQRRGVHLRPMIFPALKPGGMTGPNAAFNRRKVEYAAAVAYLVDGILIPEPPEPTYDPATMPEKWWREGWRPPELDLGTPLGPMYQEHGYWRRNGTKGAVIVDPTFLWPPGEVGRAWVVTVAP